MNGGLKALTGDQLESKVGVVMGTRPGIVMLSPVIRELQRRELPFFVLHSGQHFSRNMDRQLLEELVLPEPDHHLERDPEAVMHGAQTAVMLAGCERVLVEERPKLVLVAGDANTSLAAALAARKLHIQVGHIEAGERSCDWRMPEEHNRVIIDHISDHLFATNDKGRANLVADNVRGRISVTGNPIVDATRQNVEAAHRRSSILDELDVQEARYLVLTTHREENVDSPSALADIVESVVRVVEELRLPVVFPVHPRTMSRLERFGLMDRLRSMEQVRLTEGLGYLDFLRLLAHAATVLTDSGGVQQEACILRVPAVTLRVSTEWTETVAMGANTLAGTSPTAVVSAVRRMLGARPSWGDPFGDGRAAVLIVDVVADALAAGPAALAPARPSIAAPSLTPGAAV
jgi:UDP-N-acetylglucosamine 2-epimerase (non-hydrolysing)